MAVGCQTQTTVPAGKYKLIVYLRVSQSSGQSPSWFDDLKITVKRAQTEKVLIADVQSHQDYYAFGMQMPGRSYTGEGYRYGFNGHEKDDEIKGSGNHYSFGDYGYDPRLGRRWRPDPLVRKYPSISSYAGFGNNPIYYVDEDGRDPRQAGKKVTIDPTRMSVIKSSQVADNFNKKKYDEELYVNADKGFGVGLLNSIPILDRCVTKTAQKLNPLIDLLDLITNEPTDQWIAASQSDY